MAEVFLSYSSKDNVTCDPEIKDRAWVTEFHKGLEAVLKETCRPEYFTEIFRDEPNREGEIVLDEWLKQKLYEAKILISVLTGNYDNSQWCQRERTFFLTKMRDALKYNFLIQKAPYEAEEEKEIIIHKFFDEKDGKYETLCIHRKAELFSQRLIGLASEIKSTLKSSSKERPKVFLSLSNQDINFDYRFSIKSKLELLGFRVAPEPMSIGTVEDFKRRIGDALTGIQHAFFILGNKYPLSPRGTEKSIEELQFEMGFENIEIPKTIWYPEFYTNIDDQQMSFIKRYTDDTFPGYVSQKYDLLKCSHLKFLSELESKVKEPALIVNQNIHVNNPRKAFILISDKKFLESGEKNLIKTKLEILGYEVSFPLFEGTPDEIRTHRDQCINDAEYIILWISKDLADNIVTSLVGDLKRAIKADDLKKIIYGQMNSNYEFRSFNNVRDLVEYIN